MGVDELIKVVETIKKIGYFIMIFSVTDFP